MVVSFTPLENNSRCKKQAQTEILDKPVGAHETDSEDGRSGDRTEVPRDPRVLLTSTTVPGRMGTGSGRCSTTRDGGPQRIPLVCLGMCRIKRRDPRP